MRKIPALLTAAGLLVALTACSSAADEDCRYRSGDASRVITATGELGQPDVNFPTPIVTSKTQVSTLIDGDDDDDDRLVAGQPVRIDLNILHPITGELLQTTNGNGTLATAGAFEVPTVGEALECASVGDRIAIAASPMDVHGGQGISQLGLTAEDGLVFVVDVMTAYLPKADGTPQLPRSGDPSVVRAPAGDPGITIPKSGGETVDPPKELKVSLLKNGDGDTLKEDDTAVVHYTGVLWSNNEVFDSSWERGAAAEFPLVEGGLIEGFLEGLIGRQVGSQVMITVPPELGYGEAGSGAVPPNATLVFVVDILGIAE